MPEMSGDSEMTDIEVFIEQETSLGPHWDTPDAMG